MPDAPDPPAPGGQPVSQQEQGLAATAGVFAAPPPPPPDAPQIPAPPASEQQPLTRPERQLRIALWIGAFCFLSEIGVYLLPALINVFGWKPYWIQLPFVANSVVKSGTIGLLCLVAARDVRRHHRLVQFVIAGLLLWVFAGIAMIIGANLDTGKWVRFFVIGGTIFEAGVALLYFVLYRRAQRARYGLRLFTLLEFRSLTALAEVVIKGNRAQPLAVSPERVAQNVDRYLCALRSPRRLFFRLILFLFYPLALLGPERRLSFLRRHFYDDLRFRVLPERLRNYFQVAIRIAKQLCYAGYYNDPVTWKAIHYDPFPRRAGGQEPGTGLPPDYPKLKVEHATPREPLEGDVVIIGSGAGGSILAHQLVTNSNRDVLMLERGSYVSPRDFSADEAQMLAGLYGEGALQLSTDFRYQVLQGNCVGGSTVVNNAVCFPLPPSVLATWNQPPFNVGISQGDIDTCTQAVETLIGKVSQANAPLQPGGAFFEAGALALGRDPHVVDANIDACVGCGYCNIGCAYGKKLSMLDRVLPVAQQAGQDRMRIVQTCEAERLVVEDGRIRAVVCRNEHGKRVTVHGNTFVLSAGALASSLLLLRSGIKTDRAGLGLSFNMGSPITAVFGQPIHSYNGLQISHYARAKPPNRWILETWFNPPVAQALAMPGWFERHFDNMNRYVNMTSVGVLVGTESNGSVKLGGLLGSRIDYEPTTDDFKSMMRGIVDAGEIMLEGGAVEVLPATMEYLHYENKVELQSFLNKPLTNEGLTLGTGHPQGGNVMSSEAGVGVVDPQFKVHGKENLFVCDGSVFPTSVGVNPQLSVMALAVYAAPGIAAN